MGKTRPLEEKKKKGSSSSSSRTDPWRLLVLMLLLLRLRLRLRLRLHLYLVLPRVYGFYFPSIWFFPFEFQLPAGTQSRPCPWLFFLSAIAQSCVANPASVHPFIYLPGLRMAGFMSFSFSFLLGFFLFHILFPSSSSSSSSRLFPSVPI
jgi:hypothetical protein